MPFQLSEINARIVSDPESLVAESDARYDSLIAAAAEKLCSNLSRSPIALLAGPSGSGKTTSAQKLGEHLLKHGVRSHVISLDNYFLPVTPELTPKTEDGKYDFESPECLDMPLLRDHFGRLTRGEAIDIPYFDFTTRSPDASRSTPLKIGRDEVVIFEGIHALNNDIGGAYPEATKLFVSAESDVEKNGRLLYPDEWARFLRRLVRDSKFRNTDAAFTIGIWDNVLRGERLYIRPFVKSADLFIDTAHAYDVPVLSVYALPLLEALPKNDPQFDDYRWLIDVLAMFTPLDEKYIRPEALIREFIGGGTYAY